MSVAEVALQVKESAARHEMTGRTDKLTAHYVSAELRAAVAQQISAGGKKLPPHIAKTMKKLEVLGVEIKEYQIFGPGEEIKR